MKNFFFTIFLIIITVEIILRVTGFLYYKLWIYRPGKYSENKIHILCLGESTTFGVGALKGEDYPTQLNLLLDQKYPGKFIVYNRGVPDISSSLMLLNLRKFLNETNPNFVVLLCGVNGFNRRLTADNSLLVLKDANYEIANFSFAVSTFFRHFRTYRLITMFLEDKNNRFFEYKAPILI